jgi:hypothetical protein
MPSIGWTFPCRSFRLEVSASDIRNCLLPPSAARTASINLLPLDVEMTRPSAFQAYGMTSLGVLPHDRPAEFSALPSSAPGTGLR